MKALKKRFSVVLALALLIQCCFIPFYTVCAQEADSIVRNSSFENGSETEAEGWGLWPGWDKGSFITTTDVHSGERALKIDLNGDTNYALYAGGYTPESFNTSAAIMLSAYVKYENLEGGFNFGVERKHNNNNVADSFSYMYTGSSNGWVKICYEIPATVYAIDELIIKFNIERGSGALLIDDVAVEVKNQEKNIIQNAGYEQGDIDRHWGNNGGASFLTGENAYSGNYSLKIAQSDRELAFWSDAYDSSVIDTTATITYSVMVNYTNVTGAGFRIIAECGGSETFVTKEITGSSDGWKEITFEIPADSRRTSVLFKAAVYAGEGVIYFDDASISVANKQNYLKNAGFEGGANNCWGLYNDAHNNYATSESHTGLLGLKVEMSYDYKFSVWSDGYDSERFDVTQKMIGSVMIRYEDVEDGNIYLHLNRGNGNTVNSEVWNLRDSSNGWAEYSFEIPADPNATLAQMQIEISQGEGTVWIDDFRLCSTTSNLINYAYKMNHSFENAWFENGVVKANDWGMYPSWNENAYVSSEKSYTGSNSVKITLSEEQNYAFWRSGFNADMFNTEQALAVSAWINVPADTPVNGVLYFAFERSSYNAVGKELTNYTTNGEWVRITSYMPANEAESGNMTFKCEVSKGSGVIYIDNIEIYPVPAVTLSEADSVAVLDNDSVRAGDSISVTVENTNGKVAHIFNNGNEINALTDTFTTEMNNGTTTITANYHEYVNGDVNEDGNADILDLICLKKYTAGQNTVICSKTANIVADDVINALDVSALRKLLLALI